MNTLPVKPPPTILHACRPACRPGGGAALALVLLLAIIPLV